MYDERKKWWRPDTTRNNLRKVWNGNIKELYILDVETSGLKGKDVQIIQLAVVKYKMLAEFGLEKLDERSFYIRPNKPINQKIEELTGITNEFLLDKPDEVEIFSHILDYLGDSPNIAGYNVRSFDIPMIQELYRRNGAVFAPTGVIDVLDMAKDIYPETSHKLQDICEKLGIDGEAKFHNALEDAYCTARLLRILSLEYLKDDVIGFIKTPRIYSIQYYKGRSWKQDAIYVNTSVGTILYSIWRDAWKGKDVDISTVAMQHVWEFVLNVTGLLPDEFKKFRGYLRKEDFQ